MAAFLRTMGVEYDRKRPDCSGSQSSRALFCRRLFIGFFLIFMGLCLVENMVADDLAASSVCSSEIQFIAYRGRTGYGFHGRLSAGCTHSSCG